MLTYKKKQPVEIVLDIFYELLEGPYVGSTLG